MIAIHLVLSLGTAGFLVIFGTILYFTPRQRAALPSELEFTDLETDQIKHFPSLQESGSLSLTVVVPCYNESQRLPIMLRETVPHLLMLQKTRPEFTWEIIVVDDASNDATIQVAKKLAFELLDKSNVSNIRIMSLQINRGKGGAVTQVFKIWLSTSNCIK